MTARLEESWLKKANDYIAKIRQNPQLEKPPKKPKEPKKKNKEIYKANGANKEEEIELNVIFLSKAFF